MTKQKNKTTSSKKKPEIIEESTKKEIKEEKTLGQKLLVFLGVVVTCALCIYLMYYFFVARSYLKINMSTDKKVENITINGSIETIATQKYVSDLQYTMRYDMDKFKIFKYKNRDIFKYIAVEKILVMVERTSLPQNCTTSKDNLYNSCQVTVDNYTEEYYITKQNKTFKITVKTPGKNDYKDSIKARIDYMLNSFTIVVDEK